MDISQIRAIVTQCYADKLDGVDLEDDWDLIESGFIDSLELVNLVEALETGIPGLRIPDSDATKDNLGSVEHISAYLNSRGV